MSDLLATRGVKKAQAEKALESLAEQGKLVRASVCMCVSVYVVVGSTQLQPVVQPRSPFPMPADLRLV